jgi:hypothetical protein
MPPNPEDKFYEKNGVTPPTRDFHGTQEDVAKNLAQSVKHDWRQRGAVLFCIACPWEHATEPRFTKHILQGTDEKGMPILKKL